MKTTNDQTLFTFSKTARSQVKGCAETYAATGCANTINCFDVGESRASEIICISDTQTNTSACDGARVVGALTRHTAKDQPIVCIASDTGKAAVDDDLCGTLHVGGGAFRALLS